MLFASMAKFGYAIILLTMVDSALEAAWPINRNNPHVQGQAYHHVKSYHDGSNPSMSRPSESSKMSRTASDNYKQLPDATLEMSHNNCYLLCLSRPDNISGEYQYAYSDVLLRKTDGCLCRFGLGDGDTNFYEWDALAKTEFTPTEDCTIICQKRSRNLLRGRRAGGLPVIYGAFFQNHRNGYRYRGCACYNEESMRNDPGFSRFMITDEEAIEYAERNYYDPDDWRILDDVQKFAIKEETCRDTCGVRIGFYYHFCSCYSKRRHQSVFQFSYHPQSHHLEFSEPDVSTLY